MPNPAPRPAAGSSLSATRFSVLDRSRTREGHPDAEALRDTVALAREAEGLGFHRFWVSERRRVPISPVPNHQPFLWTEQA